MIKRLPVARLRPGMYIHDLDSGWLDHPFLRNRFRVEDRHAIERIAAAGIREVYIDTERGLDADEAEPAQRVQVQTREALHRVARKEPPALRHTPLAEELVHARRVRHEANRVITGIMADARLGRQVERERADHAVDRMAESILRNKDALLSLGRIRHVDRYTFEHSVSVAALMIAFAHELRLERAVVHEIGVGALLHDVGKIRIPDAILNKPGRLDADELAVMRRHAAYSRELLAESGIGGIALQVAAEHHERYDGTGYPHGLAADAISRWGQMAAIVDVYDAITANRVYHRGEQPTHVLGKLLQWSRFHFEPELVQHFVRCVGIYPVGTLVRLSSGRLAVVLATGEKDLLHPVVEVVFDARHRRPLPPQRLDLGADDAERVVQHEDPAAWGIEPHRFLSE